MRGALPTLLVAWLAACASNPTPRCEVAADCPAHDACYRGVCLPDSEVDGGPPSCPMDRLLCDDRCVDPEGDDDHCGGCGIECVREDDERCMGGACVES